MTRTKLVKTVKKEPRQYKNRFEAARPLAKLLEKYSDKPGTVLLAISCDDLPIGSFLAQALRLPLDLALVKKIEAPGAPGLVIGAVTLDDSLSLNNKYVQALAISPDYIATQKKMLVDQIAKKAHDYNGGVPTQKTKKRLAGHQVILVADGVATGHPALAVIKMIKRQGAARVVLASPVISKKSYGLLSPHVSKIISPLVERRMLAVGLYYQDFAPVSDFEANSCLKRSKQ